MYQQIVNNVIIGLSLFNVLGFFAWLLFESRFLTVRLPVGRISRHDFINIYDKSGIEQAPEFTPRPLNNPCANLLSEKCFLTNLQEYYGKNTRIDTDRLRSSQWRHVDAILNKRSYQEMAFGDSVITISATSPKLYEYIDDAQKAQHVKPHDGFAQAPFKGFIPGNVIPNRYTHDSKFDVDSRQELLVSKEWLKEHEHDLDGYEPTIDISVNDKTFNVNGNYKPGLIKDFMLKHTKRIRVGRKMETVFEGAVVMDLGGGLKVVTYPEQERELATV